MSDFYLPPGYRIATEGEKAPPTGMSDAPEATLPPGYRMAPEAEPPVDPVGMAKAYGVGVGEGVIGIPGMPGDLAKLGKVGASFIPEGESNTVTDWLRRESAKANAKMGGAARGDMPGSFPLPSSDTIKGWVQKVTGPFYEPKNQAERDAKTTGNYTATAALNPGGAARKLLAAGAGAAADIVAGHYSEENPYVKALAGVLAGGGTSWATSPGSLDKLLRSKLPNGITEAHVTQAGQLIERAASGPRPVNLTWPEALSQVTGQPVALDLQRVLESNPTTRNRMQEFMAPRAEQVEGRARVEAQALAPNMPHNADNVARQASDVAQATVDNMERGINTAARPYYQAAEPVQVGPQVDQALRTGPYGAIYDRTLRQLRDPNHPEFNATIANMPDDSVAVIDLVQRRMRERGDALRQPGEGMSNLAARNLDEARNPAIQAADVATGSRPGVIGDYEMARTIEAQLREHALAPLEAGPIGQLARSNKNIESVLNILFGKNPPANSERTISDAMQAIAAQRPAVAEAIARQHVEMTLNRAVTALQNGGNQFGGARLAKDLVGNPQERANLRAAIEALPNGQARWNAMERMLEIMQATGQRQSKGSLTAFNALELGNMSSQGLANLASFGLSPGRWTKAASDWYQGMSAGRNLNRMAEIITDPNSGAIFRRLQQLPPNDPRAVEIFARLAARGTGATTQQRSSIGKGQAVLQQPDEQ